jgi:hypothetical protein
MVASKAVYEAVIGKARQGAGEIQPTADWVFKVLQETYCSDLRYLVDPVLGLPGTNLCPVVKQAISEFQRGLDEYMPKLLDALYYLEIVPVFMWDAGGLWADIQQRADEVSNSTSALSQSQEMGWWEGDAGKAYSQGVGDQSGAAGAIASTAGTISGACGTFFNVTLACAIAIAGGIAALISGILGAGPTLGASAVIAIGGAIVALGGALAEMYFGIEGPERQLQGTIPIPSMPGGSLSTGGGWPSATQGS